MISVDTIRLLQQKVESAVQKIEQLKSENDALRAERSELTKALSEKSELLSRFSADEKKIEDGILGALSRLDSVENALLDSGGGFNKVEADCNTLREQQAPLAASSGVAASAAQGAPAQTAQTQVQAAAPKEREPAPEQAAPVQETATAQEAAPAQEAEQTQEPQKSQAAEQELVADLFNDDSFEIQEESVPDIF